MSQPSLLCYVLPWSQHVHTEQTDERGRAEEEPCVFLCVSEGSFLASEENAVEGPWINYRISEMSYAPSFCSTVALVSLVFNLIVPPFLPHATTMSALSAFTLAVQWATFPCRGVS